MSPTDTHTHTHTHKLKLFLSLSYSLKDENYKEKVLRKMQRLRAGCSKTEPKNVAPPQTPFPGTQDSQN